MSNPDYWSDAKRHLSKQCPVMKQLITRYKGEGLRARGDGFYTLVRSVVGQQISVKAADAVWARLAKAVQPMTPKKLLATSDASLRACGLSASKVAYAKNVAAFYDDRNLVSNGEAGSGGKPSPLGGEGLDEGTANRAETSRHTPSPNPLPQGERASQASRSQRYVDESVYWERFSDDEVLAELTSIKGIGVWTAEMFLIFHLMRPDVFPVKDLGILKAIHLHYVDTKPRKAKAPSQTAEKNPSKEEKWLKPKEYQAIAQAWQPYRTVATWYLWRALDPVAVEY